MRKGLRLLVSNGPFFAVRPRRALLVGLLRRDLLALRRGPLRLAALLRPLLRYKLPRPILHRGLLLLRPASLRALARLVLRTLARLTRPARVRAVFRWLSGPLIARLIVELTLLRALVLPLGRLVLVAAPGVCRSPVLWPGPRPRLRRLIPEVGPEDPGLRPVGGANLHPVALPPEHRNLRSRLKDLIRRILRAGAGARVQGHARFDEAQGFGLSDNGDSEGQSQRKGHRGEEGAQHVRSFRSAVITP